MRSKFLNSVKTYELNDMEDVKSIITIDDEKAIDSMQWTDDGQLLAMSSPSGSIHIYLTALNIIGSSFGTRLAYVSSLLDITVVSVSEDLNDAVVIITTEVEPTLIGIGGFHVAVAMNNRAWFYGLAGPDNTMTKEKEYMGIIKSLKLNDDYTALLFTDGKLHLHLIENDNNVNDLDGKESKLFGKL